VIIRKYAVDQIYIRMLYCLLR